jgi:hypothetical protein
MSDLVIISDNQIIKKPEKPCLYGENHKYNIIRGSGNTTGTPQWICVKCGKKVKSS